VTVLFSYDPQSLDSVRAALNVVISSPTVLLYIGPDQIMPLTSVLGAVVGVVLVFWNRVVTLFGRGWVVLTRRASSSDDRKASETQAGEPQQ
jgi:hypothetical protein